MAWLVANTLEHSFWCLNTTRPFRPPQAALLADSVNHLSGGLSINLHALSSICAQYITVHQTAVTDVGESVDRSLSAMSSLMIGCEQITDNMPPIEQLMEQL